MHPLRFRNHLDQVREDNETKRRRNEKFSKPISYDFFCSNQSPIHHSFIYFLQDKKVTIISLGIGRAIDNDELVEIATDKEHVFVADDFKHMIHKLKSITKLSC